MILRGGERGILKAVAPKAQNLPAKSLDWQIKTAKFHLLTLNNGYFPLYTKGNAPCKLSRP